jgi:hypothetical protein
MKIRLKVDLHDGHGPRYVTTTMFTITEWEKQERRKLSDGLRFRCNRHGVLGTLPVEARTT